MDPLPKPLSNTEHSLRQFIEWQLDGIKQQLLSLSLAIDQMAHKQVSAVEFEGLKLQVAGLAESAQELEQRMVALEAHKSVANWLIRQAFTVGVIVGVVYLAGLWR